MAAITNTQSVTTAPRSGSSRSTATSMATSHSSRMSSAAPVTTNGDRKRREAPESPATDSYDDDGKSIGSGKWNFTRYRPEKLCSPTESRSSHTANETDGYCYITYSVDEGGPIGPANTNRVQDNLIQAQSEAGTARITLAKLLSLQSLTWTKDFSRSGGKPRAEPRHWETLQRFVTNVASEEAELARCEKEVSHRAAELALLRLDFSTGVGTEDNELGPGGKFMSDLANGSLSLVFRGQELNEPP